ncbi:MAG: hypothetical protein ACQESR_08695 [Planctomycetota bacterium]
MDDVVRRESDRREDGLRRAAFHPDQSDRLKYVPGVDDVVRRESDRREDGLRRADFHGEHGENIEYRARNIE